MKKNKLFAWMLAMLMLVVALSGCGSEPAEEPAGDADSSGNIETDPTTEDNSPEAEERPYVVNHALAELKNSEKSSASQLAGEYGIYYEQDNKHGVKSFDGKHDTGAIFYDCEPALGYFIVTKTRPKNETDYDAINSTGLIDSTGKELVPLEYAVVEIKNDRFAHAIRFEAITEDENQALGYMTDSWFSLAAEEGDTLYSGSWCVYDLTTGKKMPNASGTYSTSVSSGNGYFTYYNENRETVTVLSNGKVLPKNATVVNGEVYRLDNAIYDYSGKKLFAYDYEDYNITAYDLGCSLLLGSKRVEDGYETVLMDYNKKVVYGPFKNESGGFIQFVGDYLFFDSRLIKTDGTPVLDKEFYSMDYDETAKLWCGKQGSTYTFIDENGTIVCELTEESDVSVLATDNGFYAYKKVDDKYIYYSFKNKDFTISGNQTNNYWLCKEETENNKSRLISTLNGEVILDGYSTYYVSGKVEDGYCWVLAKDTNSLLEDSVYDLYRVKVN